MSREEELLERNKDTKNKAEYNAFEKDIAVLNIYYGSTTALGE